MTLPSPQEVISFWNDEVGVKGWYVANDAVDAAIQSRFRGAWEAAQTDQLEHWRDCPTGTLAYLLVTDQFSRNMFRGDGRSFASDARAVCAAKSAIRLNWDMQTAEPARQFFYLPLMHSESSSDQERGVRMFMIRMPETGHNNLLHARAHREVIRQYGRFPHRNACLGRISSPAEALYLENGGYGAVVRQLEAA